jgi:hypothetical protein
LTKKEQKFDGRPISGEPLKAFRKLQEEFMKGEFLTNFDPKKKTHIFLDACNVSLGGSLKQLNSNSENGLGTVAFHSRTLTEAELNYDAHDKELLAIVDCFRIWRGYLLMCQEAIVVRSDHANLQYFMTEKKLNQRQFRWTIFLADFNFEIIHIDGITNFEADALSRSKDTKKVEYEFKEINNRKLFNLEGAGNKLKFVQKSLKETIPGEFEEFPIIVDLPPLSNAEKVMYQVKLNLMKAQDRQRPDEDRIGEIFKSYHDHQLAGHGGFEKTLELLMRNGHNWHGVREDLKRYLRNCIECLRNKTRRHAEYGLLHPMPVPKKLWDEIAMDFITDLPVSEGYDTIWVIKD